MYYPFLSNVYKNRIQIIQNNCVRFSYNIDRREHISPHLKEKGILNISNRHFVQFACILYNVSKNKTPSYLQNKLMLRSNIHDVNVRNSNTYTIPQHKTTKFESCFCYNAPKVLNSILNDLDCSSVINFKKKIKNKLRDTLL